MVCGLIDTDGVCDPVPLFDHLQANTSSADQGTVVGYSCDPGYAFTNTSAASIACDGYKWSSYDVQCEGNLKRYDFPYTTMVWHKWLV